MTKTRACSRILVIVHKGCSGTSQKSVFCHHHGNLQTDTLAPRMSGTVYGPILDLFCAPNFCKQCLEKVLLHLTTSASFPTAPVQEGKEGDPRYCVEAGQMLHLVVRRFLV